MLKTLKIDQPTTELASNTTITSFPAEKTKKRSRHDELTVNDVLRSFSGKDDDPSDDEESDQFDEINDYMKKKFFFPKDIDILQWWQNYSLIYKQLSRLTMALLSIPASSATSVRIFSETARTLESRRQLLSPDSSDALVFLRHCL
ncbi:unnamed protein product [Rotaria sordida]|uniref:HAT C-terminal dimerisation domain-containing protein n=1 Tax=Rotaria sordida TaxID=392033 RepID=A0A816FZH2_9BILA|nr:unnamed protein product [Rotaria sordida]CAF1667504.1 unnamed protein product [Rotaria sordida]